ncbi:LOW QUALITY PROTEIN: transposase, partial [Streptomyces viridosporus ATCC 14672]
MSAGVRAKGQRHYDWALATVTDPRPGHRHLLVRRNRRTGELAYHRCYSTTHTTLQTLVRTAGRRWTVEETFQTPKGLAGLDECQVRLDLPASMGHPRDARARFPRRGHRTRTRSASAVRLPDPTDPRRDPASVHHARHPAAPHLCPPVPLVTLAETPSSRSPGRPLPTAERPSGM